MPPVPGVHGSACIEEDPLNCMSDPVSSPSNHNIAVIETTPINALLIWSPVGILCGLLFSCKHWFYGLTQKISSDSTVWFHCMGLLQKHLTT